MDTQKVELGRETRKELISALFSIKQQLVESKRTKTAADVAADVIASGGGPFAAAKAALKFKSTKTASKLKHDFDPLTIINKMTGSKIATAFAGRLLGRSQNDIRSAARIPAKTPEIPKVEKSEVPTVKATRIQEDKKEHRATQVTSKRMQGTLDIVAKTLAIIAGRVTDISHKMGASAKIKKEKNGAFRDLATGRFISRDFAKNEIAQTSYLEKIWKEMEELSKITENDIDRRKDLEAEDRYERSLQKRKAEAVNKPMVKVDKPQESWLSGLFDSLLMGAKSLLGMLTGGFSKITGLVGGLIGGILVAMKKKIGSFLTGAMEQLGHLGGLLKDKIGTGLKLAASAGAGLIAAGKNLVGVPSALPTPAPTTVPKTTTVPTAKPTPGGPPTKVPKEGAKEIIKRLGPGVMQKLGPRLATSLPFVGAAIGGGMAVKSLLEGDKTQAMIDMGAGALSLTGFGGMAAIPATLAATLANQAYKEMYGADPISDPDRSKRLPELIDASEKWIAEQLSSTPQAVAQNATPSSSVQEVGGTPSTVSPVAPMNPTTGMALNEAADLKAGATMQPVQSHGGTTINKVNNNNINNNTIHGALPGVRSGDSSFLRHVDKDYVPS